METKRFINSLFEDAEPGASLDVRAVSKTFRNQDAELQVLADISFTVGPGEVVGIVGPSGCGKTTLLQIVGGLQTPTSGAVFLSGRLIKEPSRSVSYVFQEESLFPWKSVMGNVLFALNALGTPVMEAKEEAIRFLELVGLADFRNFYPSQLSGGMKQRVALARALATHPDLILMDEPMASLDTDLRESLQDEIAKLQHKFRRTTVLVSHSLEEVIFLSNRVLVLSSRPARITETVEIDLPVPRSSRIRASDAFLHLKTHLWKTLHGFSDR